MWSSFHNLNASSNIDFACNQLFKNSRCSFFQVQGTQHEHPWTDLEFCMPVTCWRCLQLSYQPEGSLFISQNCPGEGERERENGNGQTHSLRSRVRTCLSSTGQIQPASALQAQSPKEAPSEQTHMLGVDPLQCTACMLWKQFLFTWRTSSSQHLSLGYIVFSFGVSRNHICCKSHITDLGFRSVSLCASFTLWQIALEQEGTRHWPALGYIFQQTLWKLLLALRGQFLHSNFQIYIMGLKRQVYFILLKIILESMQFLQCCTFLTIFLKTQCAHG